MNKNILIGGAWPYANGSGYHLPDQIVSSEYLTLEGRKISTSQNYAIEEIFEVVRKANKYFDEQAPWKTRTENVEACKNTLFQCVQIIANLAVVLAPFLPFSSEKVCNWLGISTTWEYKEIPSGYRLPEISILFERLDKSVIDEERAKL
ncbi:class I tRNA ligase family protein [Butyrivibrio sp. MC2021]|uniref:class I tRNA ligase family protein n=1 Tax=Butyrivibrio sp. MC2021 TaxID=1408306 RepID=UPI0004793AE0|nr:class I tRNA ligase family protein [Butyrivibrio sp. MC2021]